MNKLDSNLSPPDISLAIKLHRFFLSSFVGFWLRSTPGCRIHCFVPFFKSKALGLVGFVPIISDKYVDKDWCTEDKPWTRS
ncbi:hypothetical protein ES319_1Z160400v1 [Gossypium barbadense]|uniref:Uncharacterized protein n=2 Tax=Gossypium TaxID=3633 RepID=A0A5J5NC15_GOSBA|nr:hypothetical protein ES319_1Z210400v1 [Gossypium barbadense]KAB1670490.1 hypothetical protein ES319_1Z160400v1 [Gossypium barbadense]TYG81370.1 hypothetical protein ES288_D02G293600v1 [Gossypium darwinii]